MNTIGSPTYDLAKYLAGILKPLVGNTSSFIKDSSTFVEMISNLTLEPEDIMVSFDVVSLLQKSPLMMPWMPSERLPTLTLRN